MALALACLPGLCPAASWPGFRHDARRSGFTPELAGPPLALRWHRNMRAPVLSSPAVGYGKVFAGSRAKALVALDAFTGQLLWTYPTNGWIDASPVLADGFVFVASRDGTLHCVNAANGAPVWTYSTGSNDLSSPVVVNGEVYAATGYPNSQLIVFDEKTGGIRRSASLPANSSSSPTVDPAAGLVWVGSNDGKFNAFNLNTLAPVFGPAWPIQTVGSVYLSTLAEGAGVLVGLGGNDDRSLHAFNPATGAPLWSTANLCVNPVLVGSPAAAGGRLVVSVDCQPRELYAVDASTGGVVWGPVVVGSSAPAAGFAASPAVANGLVYAPGSDGVLYVVTLSSGGLVASYNLGAEAVASPAVANGWVYVGTQDSQLLAFQSTEVLAIASPDPNLTTSVFGKVPIQGYVLSASTISYKVEVGSGAVPSSWTLLSSAAAQANGATLATWDATGLLPGFFTVRLSELSGANVIAVSTAGFVVTQSSVSAISAAAGGTVSLPDGTELDIPAGALKADDTVTMTHVLSGYPDSGIPSNARGTAIVRDLSLASGPHPVFNTPVTLKLPYTAADIPGGTLEANLRVYYLDDASGQWKMVNTSAVHSDEQRIWASMNHFTTFRVMGYVPGAGDLIQALYTYPNPATGSTLTFKFLLNDLANVKVTVFDVVGHPVAQLDQPNNPAGIASTLSWDISQKASGVYLYLFEADSATTSQKMKKFLAIVH